MNISAISHKIDGAIRFFLYVLIFWLPYSPAVVESCVVTALILWLVKRSFIAKESIAGNKSWKGKVLAALKSFRPAKTCIDYPVVFFLFVCLVSSLMSIYREQALHGLLTKTLEWFIVYYLVIEVFKGKKYIKILLGIFLFTSLSTAIDSFIQLYITHKDIFYGRVLVDGYRATAAFKHSNGLGGFLTIATLLSLSLIFIKDRINLHKALFCLLTFCFLWSLFGTFSRGAWLAVILGVSFYFSLINRKMRLWGIIVASIIFVGSIVYFFAFDSSQKQNLPFEAQRKSFLGRGIIWRKSLGMVVEKPFIGHGINTYMVNFQEHRKNLITGEPSPTYAHNCYLQMMTEVGVVGTWTFFLIIAIVIQNVFRSVYSEINKRRSFDVLLAGLLSGVVAFLIHSFFDINFYSLQLSVYFWFFIGVMISICQMDDTEKSFLFT